MKRSEAMCGKTVSGIDDLHQKMKKYNQLRQIFVAALFMITAVLTGCQQGNSNEPDGSLLETSPSPDLPSLNPAYLPEDKMYSSPVGTEVAGSGSQIVEPSGVVRLDQLTPPSDLEDNGQLSQLPQPGIPADSAAVIELAKWDLGQRTGIDSRDVNILEVREMTWSDASLGCPRANTRYGQVMTPGYFITLGWDSSRYTYHTDKESNVILCEHGEPAPPLPDG